MGGFGVKFQPFPLTLLVVLTTLTLPCERDVLNLIHLIQEDSKIIVAVAVVAD